MSDEKKSDRATIAAVVATAAAGIVTLWAIFHYIIGFPQTAEVTQAADKWYALGMAAVAVAIAFAVVAMLRFALAPLITPKSAPTGDNVDVAVRSRIAPIVLTIGSVAIVALALALIIAFAVLATNTTLPIGAKIDTLLSGVFNSVLPVVATWVGTVLAFYFGSENFRQAAQSTREMLVDRPAAKKITELMRPYDRIARFEAKDEADAETTLTIWDMIHTFSAAAPRVMVFKKEGRTPLYVVRSASPPMPPGWVTDNYEAGDALKQKDKGIDQEKDKDKLTKLKEYLDFNDGKNRNDARKFRFIAENATVNDAAVLMKKEDVDDLFITKDGQPTSPVIGWITSKDLLNK